MTGLRWTVGVALLAVVVWSCGRPRPTYEYEPTETYTSTAGDPTPQRVPETEPSAEPAGEPGIVPASDPVTASPEPASAPASPPPAETATPPEAAAPAPEAAPGRWYKAKPW